MTNTASHFLDLHKPGDPVILANAWDVGTARLLVACGAKAIGTSSAAHAFTLGLPDCGFVSRNQSIEHAENIKTGVKVPVSADFENGYGHAPQDVADTITKAIESGIVAGSIEDIRAPQEQPYNFGDAVERIEAACGAIKASGRDFVLTARADGLMYGAYDLAETIRRLNAFVRVGAQVVFAPMPPNMDALSEICGSVEAPVNAICAGAFLKQTREAFANAGVARISLGSSLARHVQNAVISQAQAIFKEGDFSGLTAEIGGDAITKMIVPAEGGTS